MHLKLTVSQIAGITGVPARTIRYYNQIELFTPSGVLENGYKYFSVEKIEELRMINYLRHTGLSIDEIKQLFSNPTISDYTRQLHSHLSTISEQIDHLQKIEQRLHKRIGALEHVQGIKEFGNIRLQDFPARSIFSYRAPVSQPIEWERHLIQFEKEGRLPPSLFIGDPGFFVELSTVDQRHCTDFSGIFLMADDPFLVNPSLKGELPPGTWLTVYVRGDHSAAAPWYRRMIDYAANTQIGLADYGIERTLSDSNISADPQMHITEIQIPVTPAK